MPGGQLIRIVLPLPGGAVRVLPGRRGLRLPDVRAHFASGAEVVSAASAAVGTPVVLLRTLDTDLDSARRPRTIWMLARARAVPPQVGLAVRRGETGLLAEADDRRVVQAWFAAQKDRLEREPEDLEGRKHQASTGGRTAWSEPDWHDRAVDWLDAELAKSGRTRKGPVEQHKTWSISALFAADTDGGRVWLKAVPPLFGTEPAITACLARLFPGLVPRVAAHDPERGLLLLEHLDAPIVDDILDDPSTGRDEVRALAVASVRRLVEIQTGMQPHLQDVVAAGAEARPASDLPAALDWMCETPELRGVVDTSERVRLMRARPRVEAAVERLAVSGLPDTLVHGDFHYGNVAAGPDGPVLFDWSDAAVAPPTADLPTIEIANGRVRDATVVAYLDAWREASGGASVDAALEPGRLLADLHHAVSYVRICAAAAPADKWELWHGMRFFVRRLLRPGAIAGPDT